MQIDDNQLIVTDVVASGGFGTVYKGALGCLMALTRGLRFLQFVCGGVRCNYVHLGISSQAAVLHRTWLSVVERCFCWPLSCLQACGTTYPWRSRLFFSLRPPSTGE